jgi:hypothetical protein
MMQRQMERIDIPPIPEFIARRRLGRSAVRLQGDGRHVRPDDGGLCPPGRGAWASSTTRPAAAKSSSRSSCLPPRPGARRLTDSLPRALPLPESTYPLSTVMLSEAMAHRDGARDNLSQRRKRHEMGDQAFTTNDARSVGERLGIDWASSPFDIEQFRAGMDIELEHGTRGSGYRRHGRRSASHRQDRTRSSA